MLLLKLKYHSRALQHTVFCHPTLPSLAAKALLLATLPMLLLACNSSTLAVPTTLPPYFATTFANFQCFYSTLPSTLATLLCHHFCWLSVVLLCATLPCQAFSPVYLDTSCPCRSTLPSVLDTLLCHYFAGFQGFRFVPPHLAKHSCHPTLPAFHELQRSRPTLPRILASPPRGENPTSVNLTKP